MPYVASPDHSVYDSIQLLRQLTTSTNAGPQVDEQREPSQRQADDEAAELIGKLGPHIEPYDPEREARIRPY